MRNLGRPHSHWNRSLVGPGLAVGTQERSGFVIVSWYPTAGSHLDDELRSSPHTVEEQLLLLILSQLKLGGAEPGEGNDAPYGPPGCASGRATTLAGTTSHATTMPFSLRQVYYTTGRTSHLA